MSTIRSVEVVIPARDEEQLIERCLSAVVSACDEVDRRFAGRVSTSITVVADGCTDETTSRSRGFSSVRVLEMGAVGVGAARRAGITHAIAQSRGPLESTWLANTDADSYMTAGWLVEQIELAEHGADVCVGGVRPDFADLSAAQVFAWTLTHREGRAAGHVHGANLGIRASTYLAVEGFRSLDEHEDVDLVERATAAGANIVSANLSDVITSGRTTGRTPGGYAGYLQSGLFAAAGWTPSVPHREAG